MERTKAYLAAEKERIGYFHTNDSHYGIAEILKMKGYNAEVKKVAEYNRLYMDANAIIYEYEAEGKLCYCAELSYRTEIDDYNVETIIFKKMPSEKDVVIARLIESIPFYMQFKGLKPTFTCWECGRTVHWLDIEGDIEQKYKLWKEKYCGC
jgi:hypothetical protein